MAPDGRPGFSSFCSEIGELYSRVSDVDKIRDAI